jgi:hypothetical protein
MSWIQNNCWTVRRLMGERPYINLRPEYQRQFVWNISMMRNLIWCMLRGQDIPKFYFHIRKDKLPNWWDVVDGQQRIETIFRFIIDQSFALSKNSAHPSSAPIFGYEVAGLTFSELPEELQHNLLQFPIIVAEMDTDDKELVIRQFLSLQAGKPLNGQERRQARPGTVKNIVCALGDTEFVKRAQLTRKRAGQYETMARLLCWELADNITDTGAEILDKLYIQHAEDPEEAWKYIKQRAARVLNNLDMAFPESHPKLRQVVSFMLLYWLMRHLLNNYVIDASILSRMPAWFDTFSKKKRRTKWTSSTTGGHKNAIRFKIMLGDFLNYFPDIAPKDPQRIFTKRQRRVLWENVDGRCQFIASDGAQCEHTTKFTDFEADHILPHAQGGPTSIQNGRVLCGYRNRGGQGICPFQQPQT